MDLVNRTCSCKKWQLSGIPCVHVVSFVAAHGGDLEAYVDECYHISTYLKVYELVVNPISGLSIWPRCLKIPPLPPKKMKLPSSPKKVRKREVDEDGGEKNKPIKLSIK